MSLSTDRPRAERFLRALFEHYPALLRMDAGARLVAYSISWVTHESVRDWIAALREMSTATVSKQRASSLCLQRQ